jgi:hypothetical protein
LRRVLGLTLFDMSRFANFLGIILIATCIFGTSTAFADPITPVTSQPTNGIGMFGNPNLNTYNPGGKGGKVVDYFEIDNADHYDIPWANYEKSLNDEFANANKPPGRSSDNAQLILSKEIGSTVCNTKGWTNNACILWQNVSRCSPGTSAINRLNPDSGKSVPGCRYPGTVLTFPYQQELHTFFDSPKNPPGIIDLTVGYNLRIWRGPSYSLNGNTGETTKLQDGKDPLIWSRAIAQCPGPDTDPQSLYLKSQSLWWQGKTTPACDKGGDPASESALGGPLGALTPAQEAECFQNLNRAIGVDKTKLEYRTYPGGPLELPWPVKEAQSNMRNVINNDHLNACYWTIDLAHHETLYAEWGTSTAAGNAGNSGNGTNFFYAFSGGTPQKAGYYAVQGNQMDHREQLLMTDDFIFDGSIISKGNYFSVFVPLNSRKTPCPSKDNPPPCGPTTTTTTTTTTPTPTPVESNVPDPQVNLAADRTVPARVRAQATVTTTPPGRLQIEQALFPEVANLYHWSPQITYDGSQGGPASAYRPNYVEYDSDVGPGLRPSAPWSSPTHGSTYIAHLKQPIHSDGFLSSTNAFKLTWLRPTLENPCPDATPAADLTSSWPLDATTCQAPDGSRPRNAWDDALWSTVDYEARWLRAGSTQGESGWRSNETLRCFADPGTPATPAAGCNPWFTLYNFSGPYYTTDAALKQYATGYLYANPPERDPNNSCPSNWETRNPSTLPDNGDCSYAGATVHTELKMNGHYDTITHSTVSVRGGIGDGSVAWDSAGNRTDLHFCKPGVPDNARLAIQNGASSNNPAADDRLPKPTEIGDTWCKGYAVDWTWNAPYGNGSPGYGIPGNSSQYNNLDFKNNTDYAGGNAACSLTDGPQPAKNFSPPTYEGANGLDNGQLGQVDAWGRYTMYGSSPKFEGNLDLSYLNENGTPTIPYTGNRPGNNGSYKRDACAKFYLDGHQRGYWVADGLHHDIWLETVANPDIITYITNPNCKLVKTTHVTTKTVKGKKVKTTTYTYDLVCPPGESALTEQRSSGGTRTIPHDETHPQYKWVQGGNILPANSDEQKITPNWPVYSLDDLKNDYYTGTSGNPGYNGMPTDAYLEGMGYKDFTGHDTGPAPQDPGFGNSPGNFDTQPQYFSGWLQTGHWQLSGNAEAGYGNNQSGYRLPENPYTFEWEFGNLNSDVLDQGVQWAMTANYDGTKGWKWMTQTKSTPRTNDSTAMVGVYGFKNSR